MVRRVLSAVLQTVLLLLTFFVGSILPAVSNHLVPMWRVEAGATRYFVLDGLILMVLVYLVILAIEAARKRLAGSAPLTTVALLVAAALGILMKFPFMERSSGL